MADSHSSDGSTAPPRVLIIDDHRDTADSLAVLAQLWGHEVRVCYSGGDALGASLAFRPDVVLLDIALPGLDGCTVARQLRRQEALAGVLLVAVSGYADQRRQDLAAAAGFDRYLVKPIDPEEVRTLLAAVG